MALLKKRCREQSGPFPRRCYSAPRRRVSTSMTMKPAATIAAFKFSVSAKSAAALRNCEEGGHYDPLLLPARSSSPARHDANYLNG